MTEWHPNREDLERFLNDLLSDADSRALQRHLFTCASCEESMIALLPGPKEDLPFWGQDDGDDSDEAPSYEGLVQRVLAETRGEIERRESRLERERREAAEIWRELAAVSPEEARTRAYDDPRLHSWGLFELLLDRARRDSLAHTRQAEELLRLALVIAGCLDSGRYGPGSVEAAHARAWAYLGNVLRIRSDFQEAERAFQMAERHLSRSWLDPLDEALVLELQASLRRAQRRFEEALEMLDSAIALYREVNEPHFQGRCLVKKGLALQYANATDEAAACFRSSLFLLNPPEDPRLVLAAHYGLIHCLHDSGRFAEARTLIVEARPLWQESGSRLDLVRLNWLEGKVAHGLGRPEEAEATLLEVRREFELEGIAYDAALASLDLAAVYARQGRTADTKRLAREMLPIFQSREVHREALAALIQFRRAAEMEQLTLSLVDEIAAYLRGARDSPGLRFRGEAAGASSLLVAS
ncbi:MAG TPA: tetratricopeptide repeat protein [Thermoanaerobaculia bacterium]|nr:tetratricopeptide repeat protein [Thermoanaerobaculia bacterium]